MICKTRSTAPVNSKKMPTIAMVILVTPARKLEAPMTAYTLGDTHGPSGGQLEKRKNVGYRLCKAAIATPTARPKQAPMAVDGRNIPFESNGDDQTEYCEPQSQMNHSDRSPAGIFRPNVTAVRAVFATTVNKSKEIILKSLSRLRFETTRSVPRV